MLFLDRKVRIFFFLNSLLFMVSSNYLNAQGFTLPPSEEILESAQTVQLSTQCLLIDTFVLYGAPGLTFDTTLDAYSIECNDSYEDNCNCCISLEQLSLDNVQVPREVYQLRDWSLRGSIRNIACNLNNEAGIPVSTRFIPAFCHC